MTICPACGHRNLSTVQATTDGLRCNACQVGYMPDSYERVSRDTAKEVEARVRPANIRSSAEMLHVLGWVLFILGVIICAVAVFFQFQEYQSNRDWTGVRIGAGFVVAGFWIEVLAQIVFIRAAMEERKS